MTEAVGNLRANLTADWADFRSELQRSSDAAGKFGSEFGKMAGSVARAGLGLFAGFAVTNFVTDSIRAATAAQELEAAFAASFGDAADSAEAWADSLADSLGRSNTQVHEIALGFQNLFGEIAPTNDAAAEASQHFTELAIDFAALKDIRTEDAFRAIQQGLAGNARGLRQYGVDLSETAVRTEALRQGVIDANEELSAEQATLVRASIIMREFGDATGEAARQSGGAAEEQERLQARLEDTRRRIGEGLLPALTALQGALADALEGFNDFFEGIGEGLARNDAFVIGITQLQQALRGTPRSFDEVAAALRSVREEQANGSGQNEAATGQIRGLSAETEAYADTLTNLAGTLESGGPRGRQRSWAEKHASDIQRLREIISPTGEAIREFARQTEIAERAGLELGEASITLARQLIESAGGIAAFKNATTELPQAFQDAIAAMQQEELTERVQALRDELKEFANELNEQFDPESSLEERLSRINEAFREGLISIDVYKAAVREATGADEKEAAITERMRELAEERDKAWSRLSDSIADVASGTRDAGEAAKQFVLEWLRAQWIEPFLNRLFQGGQNGGGVVGGLFSGGGIFGAIGNFFSGFGGGKADGGPVVPGMAYMVGERGRELFVPDEPGTIVPADQTRQRNVTMVINTPDANSFRMSRRQIERDERRRLGVD